MNRRFRQGLAFQVAYTVGKAEDAAGNAQEVTEPERERGPASHDVRHVLKMNAIWQIPFTTDVKVLDSLLGGWQVNAITIYQSGNPFSVVCGLPYPQCDFNADGQTNDRVNVTRTDLGNPSQSEWLAGVLTATHYTLPARGTLATQPRNAFPDEVLRRGAVGPDDEDVLSFRNVTRELVARAGKRAVAVFGVGAGLRPARGDLLRVEIPAVHRGPEAELDLLRVRLGEVRAHVGPQPGRALHAHGDAVAGRVVERELGVQAAVAEVPVRRALQSVPVEQCLQVGAGARRCPGFGEN